jgi:hypothetical protein
VLKERKTEAHEPSVHGQTWVAAPAACSRRSGAIVGWFSRTKRTKRTGQASRKPTLAERRAAARTAKAETALEETENKIHRLADQVRDDLKNSA